MRTDINIFRNSMGCIDNIGHEIKNGWNDTVGETFARDIIQPAAECTRDMDAAMSALADKLERIKTEIDRI